MTDYRTPLQDMRFQLWDVHNYEAHFSGLAADGCDRNLVDAILEEGARLVDAEIAPLSASGDWEGCQFDDGIVRTPAGFREAYQQFIAGGWSGVSQPVEYGGQGLPSTISMLVEELTSSGNMAWAMYPGLSRGAARALASHGTPEQKEQFLTRLVSGEWTGTMCLTEPHAGSDVGLLRTRATPNADGSYAISGTKIFISAGEHDLTDNILHLVLARTPDGPAGTKGISLFVVPKFTLDEAGNAGPRNTVKCGSIEEKMGIHGNATCVMHFDDATGYMIGAENSGMRCMFTMMNAARLAVGVQGLGLMEKGLQFSLDYALERRQMRCLSGAKTPDRPADTIIHHPEIRRLLLTQKALVEGCRSLAYWACQYEDLVHLGADEEARKEAEQLLDFLTPIAKGFMTEVAFGATNDALQIFGGHGYIRENGVEQLVRDARITLIYEGTTQIQALDLLGRKTAMTGGAQLRALVAQMSEHVSSLPANAQLDPLAAQVKALTEEWPKLAESCLMRAAQNADELGAASVDFLMYSGYVLLAHLWLKQAGVAVQQLEQGDGDVDFLSGKVATARFYFDRVLPRTRTLAATIMTDSESIMSVEPAWFAR